MATQALANVAYGPRGLELLGSGRDATETVNALTGPDERRADRQLGVVDSEGGAATFTGEGCYDWAGGITGKGFCCQGNILASEAVVGSMKTAFEDTQGELAVRLLAALAAGDAAGGDRRGRQSAALLVVRANGGYGGGNDVAVDLRVDDHPAPVEDLNRIFSLHRLVMPRPEELDFIDIDDAIVAELRSLLEVPGDLSYDGRLKTALLEFVGTENLEERWTDDLRLERGILDHLRRTKGPRTSS